MTDVAFKEREREKGERVEIAQGAQIEVEMELRTYKSRRHARSGKTVLSSTMQNKLCVPGAHSMHGLHITFWGLLHMGDGQST